MHPSIDKEKQRKAWQYFKEHFFLDIAGTGLSLLFLLFLIGTGISLNIESRLKEFLSGFLFLHSLYFFAFYTAFYLFTFPVSYLSSFRLEHKYGFSTQTLKGWLTDRAKGFIVGLVLGLIVFDAFYWFVQKSPRLWWFWSSIGFLFFSVILANLAPVLLIPIFYKYVPLKDNSLKERLIQLSRRARVKIIGVYNLKMSEKTRKANAALTGLGHTRRILLGDNLLKDYNPDEIETVIGHELGHHIHHHILRGILAGTVLTMGKFFVIFKTSPVFLNFINLPPINHVAAFPGIILSFGFIQFLITPLSTGLSRFFERQADQTAMRLTGKPQAFISTMAKFANLYLAMAYPPGLIEWYRYDHPSIGRRIGMAERFMAKGRS